MEIELNKQTARKLAIMLESGLIWYKRYSLFCDEIIEEMDKPPFWVIELATTKYIGDAIRVVNAYAFSEPFETFSDSLANFHVGCLFLRYERRELSWASFLMSTGDFADGVGYGTVKHDCEFFYHMHNDYQDKEYRCTIKTYQRRI